MESSLSSDRIVVVLGVDHAFAKQLAAVLAEADLSRGVVGHYGYGAGAESKVVAES